MRDNAITYEGLARLTDELVLLTSEGRREMAERIRHALSTDANPAENADYFAAREDQARLERRIAMLEDRIAAAELVDPDGANGVVDVGERVRLRELASGEEVAYELVGSTEADPSAGRISSVSPLGQALLGRKAGDVVVVDAPLGRRRFELLAIETPAYARG
jgi:transcription elongation factor GreA